MAAISTLPLPAPGSPDGYRMPQHMGRPQPTDGDSETQEQPEWADGIAQFVFNTWQEYKNHEYTIDMRERCKDGLRAYQGKYSARKLSEIREFGGSEVYSHLVSVKCRGATALLREVFLGHEPVWGMEPTPEPTMPQDAKTMVAQLVDMEAQSYFEKTGYPASPEILKERARSLLSALQRAQFAQAKVQAKNAEDKIQDILVEGEFYQALTDFITDLPIFPYAVLKGPVVRQVEELKWENGQLRMKRKPKLFWYRVSPMDLWFTPGASRVEDSCTLEHIKFSRADLNMLIDLPGYRESAIRAVLNDYANGYIEPWMDDSERAYLENREDPYLNRSGLFDGMEWNGSIRGDMLRDYGFNEIQIPDKDLDYFVTAWVVGRHTIKVQINPNPKKRVPYYLTSLEKVPGSIAGAGLGDILGGIESVANAALRSLVNNMSIASGPQVALNEERLSPTTNSTQLRSWKIWKFVDDPLASNNQPAIDFFQPQSNAQELLAVYQAMTNIADETSSIPRYLTGNERIGGAGRTASGLSMLMGSASKMIQTVAANIDRDVMHPALQSLYDMLLLVDNGQTFRGDENVVVKGVQVAAQKELERTRQLEFLQLTANPVDATIMGMTGRANLLRTIADGLGMPVDDLIPPEADIARIEQAQRQQQAAQQEAEMRSNQGEGMRTAGGPSSGSLPAPGPEGAATNGQEFRRMSGMGASPS